MKGKNCVVRTYQVYNFWTMSAMESRELVSSIEFVEICFVSNKAGEVKQEKDVLEVNSCFSSHYILFIWYKQRHLAFLSIMLARISLGITLKVKGRKFGTDGTNVRRMDSLLQQKWRRQKKTRLGRQSLDVILWCRWSKPYFLIAICGK